jgi:hypothetical protein
MTGCRELIEPALRESFFDSINISDDNGDCLLTFSFVRPDGDPIRLWIIENGSSYVITDEGETYGMLYLSGINVENENRKQRIEAVQQRFGLDSALFEIQKSVTADELGSTILEVYEAVHRIASLEYSRRPYPQDDFRTFVSNYLTEKIPYGYETNVSVEGFAEPQTIDFEFVDLPQPTYMQAIRAGNGSELHRQSQDTAYRFIQVRRVQDNSKFFSLVDDERGVYSESQMRPLIADSDEVIRWSEKGRLNQALAL